MRAFLAALIVCLVGFASAPAQSREIGGPYDMYAVDAPAHAVRHHKERGHATTLRRMDRMPVTKNQVAHQEEPHEAAPAGHAVSGLAREKLADGQVIVVAAAYAERFVGFFNALFAREGKLPEIGCYAPRGHMRNSLHHWGGACDVGQTARNVAWRAMYHVGDLARQFGLTDGCIWRNPDCGHVDVSGVGGGGHYVRRYASHHRRHYAGA
jgi:hypothetical protein